MMALWQIEYKFIKIMKTKYEQFLKNLNPILEDSFNEIINSLPEFDLNEIYYDSIITFDSDTLIYDAFDIILRKWDSVFTDDIDIPKKEVYLYDVESLKDLEEINELFSKYGWTIRNYSEIKEGIIKKIQQKEKDNIISKISEFTIDELRNIIKDHDNKKKSIESSN